jgi:ribosome-binding protein aMBF1 (putative translation factor)
MNEPINNMNIQVIEQNGKPAFAVLPWEDFLAIQPKLKHREALKKGIPQDVMRLSFDRDISLIMAWREYLGLSQSEVAARAGMEQHDLLLIEKNTKETKPTTIKRLADAMGINIEQLH